MLVPAFHQNSLEWIVRGEVDISAGAAVTATRGTGCSCAKTATGTYTVTVTQCNLTLVETVSEMVCFARTAPATALGCRVNSVVQNADLSLTIVLKTIANPTSGADTDTTGATTLSFSIVLRGTKPGNVTP